MNYIEENKSSYDKLYERGWGNRYADSNMISYYFNYIRPLLKKGRNEQIKVLDFGCSLGANTIFYANQGCDVYGIDISEIAIRNCIDINGFQKSHFKSMNLLEDKNNNLSDIFNTRFDLIVASEVLYYFSKEDVKKLLKIFHDGLINGGIIYANWVTYNHDVYRKYTNMKGMQILIETTGSADEKMYDYIIDGKEEMKDIFSIFKTKYIKRSMIELDGENESLHYIGIK